MKAEIFIYKTKNKFGKEILVRGIKCDEIFKQLSETEQFAWIHISNCMLNSNMKFEQVLENELYNYEVKQILINVYNSHLKSIISEYKIKKINKSEQFRIRVTPEEKQNIEIMAKEKELSISDFFRQKINLNLY
jgi:hypothetical protein